jgi:hypothetical protein
MQKVLGSEVKSMILHCNPARHDEKNSSVIVLSSASGAGHVCAADALVAAFNAKGFSANRVEVLKYTNPVFRKIYSDLYKELSSC